MTDRKPKVTAEHRAEALEVWRRSNDPAAGDDFGPELVAEALAAAEQRGLDLGRADAWIPVGERLPEEFTWCWVLWKETVQEQPWEYVERTGITGRRWWHDDLSLTIAGGVTHWMPLTVPAPPEVTGG